MKIIKENKEIFESYCPRSDFHAIPKVPGELMKKIFDDKLILKKKDITDYYI